MPADEDVMHVSSSDQKWQQYRCKLVHHIVGESTDDERERNNHACARHKCKLVNFSPEGCILHLPLNLIVLLFDRMLQSLLFLFYPLAYFFDLVTSSQRFLNILQLNDRCVSCLYNFVATYRPDIFEIFIVKIKLIE